MSLINDALKKAQRQRTEGNPSPADTTAPSTSSEQLQRVARREKPAGFRSQLMLIGGGAVAAVVLVGIGAIFFFSSGEQPTAAPAQPAPVAVTPIPAVNAPSATTPTPAPATPAAVTAALPPAQGTALAGSPAPAQQSPIASPSTPAAPPSQFVVSPATVSEPVPAPTPSAATPAPAERPKPSTRMISVIEHFRVGGIRVSGAESKVLMNDKVYRINDIVDFELGIRLTGIETKALTFEDGRGAVHIRTF